MNIFRVILVKHTTTMSEAKLEKLQMNMVILTLHGVGLVQIDI